MRRTFGVVLLVLIVLLPLGSSSYFTPCHPSQQQNNSANNQNSQESCPSLDGIIVRAVLDFMGNYPVEISAGISALATIAIAAFTGTLWWSTRGMLRETGKSINLAQMEFASSHRPMMRLKHTWLATPDGQAFRGHLDHTTPISVRLDMVNVGSTAANVTQINFMTQIVPHGQRLPQRPPYNEPGVPKSPIKGRIESGTTLTHAVSDGRILSTDEIMAIRKGEKRLFFIGTIEYWDDARRIRQTAFCRYLVFDRKPARAADTGRFRTLRDPDYEYQD